MRGASIFDPDPGMSAVEIVPLWNLDPLDLKDVHRSHHRIDGVLIIEVLIEFAPGAIIVIGAELEGDFAPHVVKAGPLGRGQGLHGLDVGCCTSHGSVLLVHSVESRSGSAVPTRSLRKFWSGFSSPGPGGSRRYPLAKFHRQQPVVLQPIQSWSPVLQPPRPSTPDPRRHPSAS
jgi:hypothetical protein